MEEEARSTDREVDKEFPMNLEGEDNTELQQSKSAPLERLADDDFSPLSGKPYCMFILAKSHVKPVYHMVFPAHLNQDLPSITIPAEIACRGKTWNAIFHGDCRAKRLDISWKAFVIDNKLKVGDGIVWEVMESSNSQVKFKVQIIKGDFPGELQSRVNGNSEATAIVLD